MAKVYAVVSGKGGVGKSTVAANLGVSLGHLREKTIVIDADLAMDGVSALLDVEGSSVALQDVLAGEGKFKEAVKSVHGIEVIPSGETIEGFLSADPEGLKSVIDEARRESDYVIIDTPPSLDKYSLPPIKAADEVLMVVTPELPSIKAVKKLQTVSGVLGKKIAGVIINRLRKPSFFERLKGVEFMDEKDIELKLKANILGVIPEDRAVIESVNEKEPVVAHKPKSSAAEAFDELAEKISEVSEKEKPPEEEEVEEEIDYQELSEQAVSDIKKKAEELDLDYRKLLEVEKENKDRKTLKEWLEKKIESSKGG